MDDFNEKLRAISRNAATRKQEDAELRKQWATGRSQRLSTAARKIASEVIAGTKLKLVNLQDGTIEIIDPNRMERAIGANFDGFYAKIHWTLFGVSLRNPKRPHSLIRFCISEKGVGFPVPLENLNPDYQSTDDPLERLSFLCRVSDEVILGYIRKYIENVVLEYAKMLPENV